MQKKITPLKILLKTKYCAGTLSTSRAEYPKRKEKVHSTSTASVTLHMEAIEEVDHFTYLGSVIDAQSGTEADVKARIGKATVAFLQLKNILNSNVLSLKNKIRISIQMSRLFFFTEQRHGGPQ